jgi:hypothetical protein
MIGNPTQVYINFDAPAVLRKWPSLRNERRTEKKVTAPYLLVEGTLDECLLVLIAKPASVRHLYEIHTSPQPPLVSAILSGEHVAELGRLRDFRVLIENWAVGLAVSRRPVFK